MNPASPIKEGNEIQLVNIVGESVSFVPTGLSPSETTIVDYERYYRPDGISDEESEILKKSLRKLFDGKRKAIADPVSGEDSENYTRDPLPPCSEMEKFLVLQSLLHRKRVLFQQLYDNGILTAAEIKKKVNEMKSAKGTTTLEGKDSLFVRNLLIHLLRLEKFMEHYVDEQQCINLDDYIYGKNKLDLDDDRIRELLKQFVFFVLQSSNPLAEYNKTKPTAATFISRLEKDLLKDKFPTYLQSYKDNKFPIPPRIAKVLEATDIDAATLKQEFDKALEFEREKILQHLKTTIPQTHIFWKRVGDPKNPIRIIDAFQEQEGDLLSEIKRLEKEKNDVDAKRKTCEQSFAALQAEKARLLQKINALKISLQSRTTTTATQQQQLQALQIEKRNLEQQITQLQAAIQAATGTTTQQQSQLQTLQAEKILVDQQIAALRLAAGTDATKIQQLEQEKQALQQDFGNREAALQKQIQDCLSEKNTLQEKLRRMQEIAKKFQSELQTLRAKAKLLEDYKTQADKNIQELQQKHQAALAGEQAKIKEKEDALLAEQAAKKKAQQDVVNNQLQLVQAQTALRNALTRAKTQEESIANLQRLLQEKDNEDLRLREEIKTKQDENKDLAGQIAKSTTKINELEGQIQSITESLHAEEEEVRLSNEQLQKGQQSIADLTKELELEKSKLSDKEKELQACQKQLESIKSSVTGSKEEFAKLEAELVTVRGERDKAIAEQKNLQTLINTLQSQVDDAEEEKKQHDSDIAEKDKQIEALQDESKAKNIEISEKIEEASQEKERADEAEAKVAALEKEKIELLTSTEKRLTDAQGEYDASLSKGIQEITQKVDEVRQKLDVAEALKEKEKKEKEIVLALIKDLDTWITTGEESSSLKPVASDVPGASSFSVIVKRLEEKAQTLSQSLTEKKKGALMQCYYVFLISFLWQTNFPALTLTGFTAAPPSEEKTLYNMINSILFQGFDPKDDKKRLGGEFAGVYSKYKDTVYNTDFMKDIFRVLQMLGSALVNQKSGAIVFSTNAAEQTKYVTYVNDILTQVKQLNTIYSNAKILQKEVKKELTFQEKAQRTLAKLNAENNEDNESNNEGTEIVQVSLADYVKDYLLKHQPQMEDDIFKYRIEATANGIEMTTGSGGSQLNYAVLFYMFLLIMRDYLITIENTDSNLCRLPEFLKK